VKGERGKTNEEKLIRQRVGENSKEKGREKREGDNVEKYGSQVKKGGRKESVWTGKGGGTTKTKKGGKNNVATENTSSKTEGVITCKTTIPGEKTCVKGVTRGKECGPVWG